MRLGLSTLIVCALSASALIACGDETTGAGGGGGAGGAGTGGSATVGEGGAGTGGTDPGVGGAGGGTTDECGGEVVLDDTTCDAGCDGNFTADDGAVFCTYACAVDADCSTDDTIVCYEGSCLLDCSGDNACPNATDYSCDQTDLVCLPVAG